MAGFQTGNPTHGRGPTTHHRRQIKISETTVGVSAFSGRRNSFPYSLFGVSNLGNGYTKEVLPLSERGERATSTHEQLAADVQCHMQ